MEDDAMTEVRAKLSAWGIALVHGALPITDDYVERVERKVGAALPDDYAWFLRTYGASTFDTYGVSFPVLDSGPWQKDGGFLDAMFGCAPETRSDLLEMLADYEGRVPTALLPIGEDPGGNLICLGVTGSQRGKVYFWDHDNEGPDSGSWVENVFLIASSFEEFLKGLYVDEEAGT